MTDLERARGPEGECVPGLRGSASPRVRESSANFCTKRRYSDVHCRSSRSGERCSRRGESGYYVTMISAIFSVIGMVLGLVLDIVTLPFRTLFALLGGAEFEFRRFSRT